MLDDIVIPSHLLGNTDEIESEAPVSEDADESPELDTDELDVLGDETDDETEGATEETNEEVVEEEEEESPTTDEEETEETSGEDESFLPPFDRNKLLKEHPELELPFKHMQRAFTKKMQTLAEERELVQTNQAQLDEFMQTLETADGREEFFMQFALGRPEEFQAVYDKFAEMTLDEDAKKAFLREQKLKEREKKLEATERVEQTQTQQQRIREIGELTENTAEEIGLTTVSSLEVAKKYVLQAVQEAIIAGKAPTNEMIVAAVKSAAKDLGVERKEAEKTVKTAERKKALESAQKQLKNAKKPQPPKGGKAARAIAPAKVKVDPLDDPISALVKQKFLDAL